MSQKEMKIMKYSEDQMDSAMKAVRHERLSARAASRLYLVPKTTLINKLNGKHREGRKMGRNPFLGLDREEQLVQWIKNQCTRGIPPKKCDVLNSAMQIVKKYQLKTPFVNDRPSINWLKGFMKRNKSLTVRTPDLSSNARSKVKEEDIRSWFHRLEEELRELQCFDIFESPSRIFNMDETCIQLAPITGKVIGIRGWKNIYEVSPGPEKSNLTFLRTFSASGEIVTPNIIFPYLRIPHELAKTVPTTWFIGASDSGWMKTETFYDYVAKAFIPWVKEKKIKVPVILFVDGDKTHTSVEISWLCKENDIILYLLPPHTNNILQPAYVGPYKPFKQLWKEQVHAFRQNNRNISIRRKQVCPLLALALEKVSKCSIKNGFAATGLYPFDPNRPKYDSLVDQDITPAVKNSPPCEEANPEEEHEENRYKIALDVFSEKLPEVIVQQLNGNEFHGDAIQKAWTSIKEEASSVSFDLNCVDECHEIQTLSETIDDSYKISDTIDYEQLLNETNGFDVNEIEIHDDVNGTNTSPSMLASNYITDFNNIASNDEFDSGRVSLPGSVTYSKRKCADGKLYFNMSSEKFISHLEEKRNKNSPRDHPSRNKRKKMKHALEEDWICEECCASFYKENKEGISTKWIECDKCPRRFHIKCIPNILSLDTLEDDSIDEDTPYLCLTCSRVES